MPEAKQISFAETVMARTARPVTDSDANAEADSIDSGTRERQTNATAFALEVIFKDGRRRQNFPWALYGGHEFSDENGMECLMVLFGQRVLIMRGYHFESLNRDLALGKRSSIRQHNSHQVQMLRTENAEDVPIVVELETYPDYLRIVAEMKGEEEHETRNAGRAGR
jgi:hypothetical protein